MYTGGGVAPMDPGVSNVAAILASRAVDLSSSTGKKKADTVSADSKDHVKVIRANGGYGGGGHVLGNAHKGLIGRVFKNRLK
jgi:hypothetical protein